MEYYITSWTSSGQITGTGSTPDGTIPSGAIPCTEAQAKTPSAYIVDISTTPHTVVDAPTSVLLAQAQATQKALLLSAYQSAVNAHVSFKNSAGVTSTYPSGDTILTNGMKAKDLLSNILSAGSSAWTLGKWLDTNNVAQTFTFADLQGLAGAMESAITLDWTDLIQKIDQVNNATSVSAVKAITF